MCIDNAFVIVADCIDDSELIIVPDIRTLVEHIL